MSEPIEQPPADQAAEAACGWIRGSAKLQIEASVVRHADGSYTCRTPSQDAPTRILANGTTIIGPPNPPDPAAAPN